MLSDAPLPELLITSAKNPRAVLLLAHGAGAPMDSDFMNAMADAVAAQGISVARFEFPYMHRRRIEGRQFPPDRAPKLIEHFSRVVEQARSIELPVWIGGKSMGGRMASMLAADSTLQDSPVQGVVALGYPFHPPGKPEKLRTGHLGELTVPMLVCQGDRDPFGKVDEVSGYDLPPSIQVHWLESGDHDLRPLKRSGLSQSDLISKAASQIGIFVTS